jgi:hypothetical protein
MRPTYSRPGLLSMEIPHPGWLPSVGWVPAEEIVLQEDEASE